MNYHKIIYYNLLTSCKLHEHLADVNKEAQEMYDRLFKQLAEQEGLTEQLKTQDQMLWVQRMNNICSRALEIVCHEIVYTIYMNRSLQAIALGLQGTMVTVAVLFYFG